MTIFSFSDRRVSSIVRVSVLALLLAAGQSAANPTGPTVVTGTAAIVQNGSLVQVTSSTNVIINWQNFSIGVNEISRFIQQSQASVVLNRVTGASPSVILGTLQSTGRVFLINPNGVLFGANSQINTTSLIVSGLQIPDTSFVTNVLFLVNNNMVTSNGSQNLGGTGNSGGATPVSATQGKETRIGNSSIIPGPTAQVILDKREPLY